MASKKFCVPSSVAPPCTIALKPRKDFVFCTANFDTQILLAMDLDRKSLEILISHYQYGSPSLGGAILCQKWDGAPAKLRS